MDIPTTQVFEDEDFPQTQRITLQSQAENARQNGTLTIDSEIYQIKKGITTIGRHLDCHIVLEDPTVSKQHAEIETTRSDGCAWICDLHSSNRTRLNNSILRPGRSYELKDGSVIHFGRVCAVYKVQDSMDDSTIPETPIPDRQKKQKHIIPATPDSSLNNSSTAGEDVSMIPSTQGNDTESMFRRPSLPQQRQSAISNKKTIIQESESNSNVSIHDTGTQKFGVNNIAVLGRNLRGTSKQNDIHEMETQHEVVDIHDVETQANISDIDDVETQGNITGIHDVETQVNITDIHDVETQGKITDIHDVETQGNIADIHDVETQGNITDIHDVETQGNITDVHDVETQGNVTDIHDVETQLNMDSINGVGISKNRNCISDMETQINDQNVHTQENVQDVETRMNSKNVETRINDKNINLCKTKKVQANEEADNISDVEMEPIDLRDIKEGSKLRLNDTERNQTRSGVSNVSNIGTAKVQSTPEHHEQTDDSQEFLKLTPTSDLELDGSELDESACLLGSQNLLGDFMENDETMYERKSEASISKKLPQMIDTNEEVEKSTDDENIFDAATQDEDENIFDAATQRVSGKSRSMHLTENSEARNERVSDKHLQSNQISVGETNKGPAKSQIDDSEDSDTDAEGQFAEMAINQRRSASSSIEIRQNRSKEVKADRSSSRDSDDLFDIPTQRLHVNKSISDTSLEKRETDVDNANPGIPAQNVLQGNEINSKHQDMNTECKKTEVDYEAPTQLLERNESPVLVNDQSSELTENDTESNQQRADITEMADDSVSQIMVVSKTASTTKSDVSPYSCEQSNRTSVLKSPSIENIDYEMAPTQLIRDIEHLENHSTPSTSAMVGTKSSVSDKVNLNDTLERNLHSMFDGVNEGDIEEPHQMSTQSLETMLQASQGEAELSIGKGNFMEKPTRGKRKLSAADLPSPRVVDKKSRKANFKIAEVDNDSQEDYFSTLTSTRKRRVLADSPDRTDLVENVSSPRQKNKRGRKPSNLNKSVETENSTVEASTREATDLVKHDNGTDTPSRRPIGKNTPTRKSSKQKEDGVSKIHETGQQEESMSEKENVTELKESVKNTTDSATSSTSNLNELSLQIPEISDEKYFSDVFPEVRVSGTLSNPASPSTPTSSEYNLYLKNTKPKRGAKKGATKKATVTRKSSCRVLARRTSEDEEVYRLISNSHSPNFSGNTSNSFSGNLDVDKVPLKPTENADTRDKYKSEKSKQLKRTFAEDKGKVNAIAEDSLLQRNPVSPVNLPVSPRSGPSLRSNTRKPYNAGRASIECSSVFQVERQVPVDNVANKSAKEKSLRVSRRGKRPLNVMDEVEHNTKKQKTDDISESVRPIKGRKSSARSIATNRIQSPSIRNFLNKTNLPPNTERSVTPPISDKNESVKENGTANIRRRNKNMPKTSTSSQSEIKVEQFSRTSRSTSIRNPQQTVVDSSAEDSNSNSIKAGRRSYRKKLEKDKDKAKERIETSTDDTTSSSMDTSIDNLSVTSTSSRTRRGTSTSVLSTSSLLKEKHKILFTGIGDDEYKGLLKELGASSVENPAKCTVLVTDKVRRTVKFLCALARSVPIVSTSWLTDSKKAGGFVEVENYILKDPAAEAKFGFKLRGSLEKAKNKKLLDGYTIVLTPNVAPPPIPELKTIIVSCGGKPLVRPPSVWPEKTVIISREEDIANANKFLAKAPKTVTIQSTEFILTGILRQELDLVKYSIR